MNYLLRPTEQKEKKKKNKKLESTELTLSLIILQTATMKPESFTACWDIKEQWHVKMYFNILKKLVPGEFSVFLSSESQYNFLIFFFFLTK